MSIFFLIATPLFLLGFSAHALMASLVLQKRSKQAKDLVFFVLMVTFSFWYLANLLASINGETLELSGLKFINLLFAFSYNLFSFTPALILHLTCLLTHGKSALPRWVLFSYLPCLPLAALPLAAGLFPGNFSIILLLYFLILLTLYFIIYSAMAGLIILRRHKTLDLTTPRQFRRGLYLIGLIFLILILGGVGVMFYTPVWSYFFLVVRFSILLLSLVLSLYLLRYNFMDAFVKKGIIYSIVSGIFLLTYLLVIQRGGKYMRDTVGIDSTALEVLLLFLLILLFQPLTQYMQRFIDRVFYREQSEYREALRKFAQSLQGETDRMALCRSVLTEILQAMKVDQGGIGLLSKDRLLLEAIAANEAPALDQRLSFLEHQDIAVWPPIQRATPTEDISDRSLGNRLLQAEIKVVVPVRSGRQVKGIILLGAKRSSEIYFKEDLDLLDAVSSHFGLALENLSLIEKKIKMERQIYHTEKLASIGELAASVAHEIRNPMAGIKCLVQQIDEEAPSAGTLKENTITILEEIDRLERIIVQLLTYSKKEEYRFEATNLTGLLRGSVDQFKMTPENSPLEILYQCPEDLIYTWGDPGKLKQVFLNILINAAQAIKDDIDHQAKILVTLEATISAGPIVVLVQDNGRGIAPEDLDRIFNPFFTRKEKGTGLGLAISKKIIEAHSGEIQIDSHPGKGAAVKISLPLNKVEKQA